MTRREFPSFLFAHLTFPVSRNWETVGTGKVKCAKAVKLGICSYAKSVPALKLGKCENCGVLGNWESVKLGNCKFSPEAVKAGNETGELSDTELGNSKIDGRQTKLGKSKIRNTGKLSGMKLGNCKNKLRRLGNSNMQTGKLCGYDA